MEGRLARSIEGWMGGKGDVVETGAYVKCFLLLRADL